MTSGGGCRTNSHELVHTRTIRDSICMPCRLFHLVDDTRMAARPLVGRDRGPSPGVLRPIPPTVQNRGDCAKASRGGGLVLRRLPTPITTTSVLDSGRGDTVLESCAPVPDEVAPSLCRRHHRSPNAAVPRVVREARALDGWRRQRQASHRCRFCADLVFDELEHVRSGECRRSQTQAAQQSVAATLDALCGGSGGHLLKTNGLLGGYLSFLAAASEPGVSCSLCGEPHKGDDNATLSLLRCVRLQNCGHALCHGCTTSFNSEPWTRATQHSRKRTADRSLRVPCVAWGLPRRTFACCCRLPRCVGRRKAQLGVTLRWHPRAATPLPECHQKRCCRARCAMSPWRSSSRWGID